MRKFEPGWSMRPGHYVAIKMVFWFSKLKMHGKLLMLEQQPSLVSQGLTIFALAQLILLQIFRKALRWRSQAVIPVQ